MRASYMRELRFGNLVLALHCYSGDKKQNTDFFQITCFAENKNMAVEKNLRVATNFYKKLCIPVITRNEKHLSKQVAALIHTLGKFFFWSCYFQRVVSCFFSDRVKNWQCILVCGSFIGCSEQRGPNKYCLWEDELFTCYSLFFTRYSLLFTRYTLLLTRSSLLLSC